MPKYQLIMIEEREIESIRFFDTYDEAYHAMEQDLANTLEMDASQLKEHENFGDGFFITEYSAWVSHPFIWNISWHIISMAAHFERSLR